MGTYTEKNNTYFVKPKDNPKDLIEKEIGDSKTPDKFLPQQKLMRWDNECNVSVRLVHDEKTPTVSTDGDKVMWKGDKIEAHFYDIPDGEGASEFEVVLKEKPKTNKVEFTLVDKDVDYFYQPALTPEEITQGAFRPENVIGSYAIYAKTPKTNWTGGKEYKTGKVGHIFRPKIIDSNRVEVWGDLHIENGILSVTIPQDFLDKAVYPVRHAAGLTMGYTTKGSSTSALYGGYEFLSLAAPSNGDGTVDKISVWSAGVGAGNFKGVIHLASTKAILTNGVGGTVAAGTSPELLDMIYSTKPSVTNGTNYYIGAIESANDTQVYYDDAGTVGGYAVSNYTTPINITTIYNTNLKWTVYATYTAGGGSTPLSIESDLIIYN